MLYVFQNHRAPRSNMSISSTMLHMQENTSFQQSLQKRNQRILRKNRELEQEPKPYKMTRRNQPPTNCIDKQYSYGESR